MASTQCGKVDLSAIDPRYDRVSPSSTFRFAKPKSPIPAQIEDREELAQFFTTFKDILVPYSGTDLYSSHALLYFLMDLAENSSTQGAVIQSMKRHCFGGKVEIIKSIDPVFAIEADNTLGEAQKRGFVDWLKSSITFRGLDNQDTNIRTFAGFNFEDLKKTGNCFVELVLVEEPDKAAFAYAHSPAHVLHVAVEKGEAPIVAVSPIWTEAYIREFPPDVIPVFPAYVEANGVKRTMFQLKNGNYKYYGRPDSISSMLYQFREFQDVDFLITETSSRFMGNTLIEIEDDNPEAMDFDEDAGNAGFTDLADRLEKNFTYKAENPQQIMLMSRPYGAKEAFVYQFEAKTGESWFAVHSEIAEQKIITSHSWSKRLMGINEASGLSTNVFLDEFEIKSATIIKEYQEAVGNLHNVIIAEVAKHFERQDVLEVSVKYSSPFAKMLEERKEALENSGETDLNLTGNEDNTNSLGSN